MESNTDRNEETAALDIDRNDEIPVTIVDRESEFTLATDIQAELGLGTSQFHNYRRHLRLNTYRQGKKAYFDRDQCESMRSLYSFVQDGGKFADYPRPEPSGADEWEEEPAAMTYSQSQPPDPRTEENSPKCITGIDTNRVKAKATALAKEQAIAQMLGSQLAENLDLLSPEDRAEIESYRSHFEAAFPKAKYSPQEITALLIPLPASGIGEGEEVELLD